LNWNKKQEQKLLTEITFWKIKVSRFSCTITLAVFINGLEKQIRALQEQGILKRIGPDKGGHWEILK
jgi:ATP-dependent DNA helicase RecG